MSNTEEFDLYQKKHLQLIQGIFSDVSIESTHTAVGNASIHGAFYNNITDIHLADNQREEWLTGTEDYFRKNGKKLTLYITPSTRPQYLGNLLKQRGYGEVYKDTWLRRDTAPTTVRVPPELKAHLANDSEKVRQFSEVFKASNGIVEDKNRVHHTGSPYDEMWKNALTNGKAKLIVVNEGNRTEGAAALIHDSEVGGIYGVSVAPKTKHHDLLQLLYNLCMQQAHDLKLNTVFIQVDVGSPSEQHLKGNGFSSVGVGEALQAKATVR